MIFKQRLPIFVKTKNWNYVERKIRSYLIDVSKYTFTGVLIASFFKDMENTRFIYYVFGMLVTLFSLLLGLVLTNKKEEK